LVCADGRPNDLSVGFDDVAGDAIFDTIAPYTTGHATK
jgi:hypothetical protein